MRSSVCGEAASKRPFGSRLGSYERMCPPSYSARVETRSRSCSSICATRRRGQRSMHRACRHTAAGYLADTRRRIETGLRDGTVRCVVATHALELGIDIGGLGAVVCAGFPGTMAGLWQRFGRAGRREADESLAVLVASSAPLDQYLAGAPHALIDAPIEQARIDPDNVEILLQHLKCAAFELPFEDEEGFGGVPIDTVQAALQFLSDHRVLHAVQGRNGRQVYHWSAEAFPAHHVPLRSVTWDNFVIIDLEKERTIAENGFSVDPHDAPRASDLPARRSSVSGRVSRLRQSQGLHPRGQAGLLHYGAYEYAGQRVGRSRRRRDRGASRASPRRRSRRRERGREGGRLQEDQVSYARECGLRRCQSARGRETDDGILGDGPRGGHRAVGGAPRGGHGRASRLVIGDARGGRGRSNDRPSRLGSGVGR